MIGGCSPTFGQWVLYGLPLVPVLSAGHRALLPAGSAPACRSRRSTSPAEVRRAAEKIGPMTRQELTSPARCWRSSFVLWITASDSLGLGGPVILGPRIAQRVSGPSVEGHGQPSTGRWCCCTPGRRRSEGARGDRRGTLHGRRVRQLLPEWLRTGSGLAIASSFLSGVTTNFMSDGATVAAIGPG